LIAYSLVYADELIGNSLLAQNVAFSNRACVYFLQKHSFWVNFKTFVMMNSTQRLPYILLIQLKSITLHFINSTQIQIDW